MQIPNTSRSNVLEGNNAHFAENTSTVVVGAGVERGQPVLIPYGWTAST